MARRPRQYAHKIMNPFELVSRYKHSAKGGIIRGQDDTVTRYSNSTNQKVRMIPAPWSMVITIALINAFLIQVARQVWFHYLGKPTTFQVNPDLENSFGKDAFRSTEMDPLRSRLELMRRDESGN